MSRRDELKKNADWQNNLAYRFYYDRLLSLAIGRFKWINLPDSVNERYLEETLTRKGRAIFYFDKELGEYVALSVNGQGLRNIYNIPDDRTAISSNGYTNSSLTKYDSVLMFNNNIYTSDLLTIHMFAKRMADTTRSIETNILLQKSSAIIVGTQEEMQGMLQAIEDVQGHVPYLSTSDKIIESKIKALNLNVPFIANELTIAKRSIWNEALTALCITNVDNNKRERLVTDEVNKDMGDVEMTRAINLQMREIARDEINKMFPDLPNGKIDVEFRLRKEEELEPVHNKS